MTLFAKSLSDSDIVDKIMILLINIPNGPDIMPIPVAKPRSLSPNQLVASLETGFFKNACPERLIIWPKNTGQNEPTSIKSLKDEPNNMSKEPINTHLLSP